LSLFLALSFTGWTRNREHSNTTIGSEKPTETTKESPMERLRIISKEGRKWKVQHSDGQVTYHKTLKAAKSYEHQLLVIDPFPEYPLEEKGK